METQLTLAQNKQLMSKAKALYLYTDLHPLSIVELLNISNEELRYYVYGQSESRWKENKDCWAFIKMYDLPPCPKSYDSIETILLTVGKEKAFRLIDKTLNKITEQQEDEEAAPLNLDDAKKLTDIFTSLNKEVRLNKGEATENINIDQKTYTLDDLNDVIDAEVVEYKEV